MRRTRTTQATEGRRWVQPISFTPLALASFLPLDEPEATSSDKNGPLPIDVEFENDWETTSDWNEDDDEAQWKKTNSASPLKAKLPWICRNVRHWLVILREFQNLKPTKGSPFLNELLSLKSITQAARGSLTTPRPSSPHKLCKMTALYALDIICLRIHCSHQPDHTLTTALAPCTELLRHEARLKRTSRYPLRGVLSCCSSIVGPQRVSVERYHQNPRPTLHHDQAQSLNPKLTNNGTASAPPIANPTSPSPIDDGVGLANVHLNQSRRKLLDLLNKLYNTGVQADVDIPQIAVIGSQSAGKSSLIESISGITCLEPQGPVHVTLRFTTDVNGQTLGQPRTIMFGPAITDKSNVEERIRRAQRAILNPGTAYRTFLDGDDEDLPKSELTFSTNCVTLQISGPGVADLSFCDLPGLFTIFYCCLMCSEQWLGLIASVGTGGNNNDIQLVENLVTSYISKPSCVILLTVACESEYRLLTCIARR
ncbi:P-loop containing nucleoside triphosphate hydrolase protein [Salix suchowensis]|nr:P-loop containing nucleoside triphosphate hydrolase protein [Salix suchowensis]